MLGLPLVGLHIELEREIRRILPGGEGRPIALSEAIRRMAGEGLELDQIVRILPAIYLANRAANGLDNDPLRRILQVTEGITANIFHMINSLAADAAQNGQERITDEVVENWRPLSDGAAAYA